MSGRARRFSGHGTDVLAEAARAQTRQIFWAYRVVADQELEMLDGSEVVGLEEGRLGR